MPFLYQLKKHAKLKQVEMFNHWIKRGYDDKPGYVFLDNSPALERDYRSAKIAQGIYEKCKGLPAEEQEAKLKQGFGALRTCYEAFVVFELFGEVVQRFEERISIGRLKDLVWDGSIATEVIERYENLSRYIEGHSHSDAIGSTVKISPNILEEEIRAFAAIKSKLTALKKMHQTT